MKPWMCALLVVSCADPMHGKVGTVVRPDAVEPAPARHVCGHQSAELAGSVDVSAVLVLDRSSSMAKGSKWAETQAAVEAALGAYDRYLRVGLLLYPSGRDVCDEVAAELDVPIALGNGAAISAALADAYIYRGTPTGAALRAAGAILEADPGSHRVVILATDGAPDCTAEGWDNGSGLANVEAFDAADALSEAGIPVYVVGIEGSSAARAVLNRLADVGGTAKPGDPAFYETTSGAELASALIEVALDASGCTTPLDPPEGALDLAVALDGRPLSAGPGQGWEVHDGRLHLDAAACLAAPGEVHHVEVTWYCE